MTWIISGIICLAMWFIFWGLPIIFDFIVTGIYIILEKLEKITPLIKKLVSPIENTWKSKSD